MDNKNTSQEQSSQPEEVASSIFDTFNSFDDKPSDASAKEPEKPAEGVDGPQQPLTQ